MDRIPFSGSGVQNQDGLQVPIVSIIATNQRSDPFLIKFIVCNFAHGETILRCELSFELESFAEAFPKKIGEVIRTTWPLRGSSLMTIDGPDLAALVTADGYTIEDLFPNQNRKTLLKLTVRPEVFAPFDSLTIWPEVATGSEVTTEDSDSLELGRFVSKPSILFEFDPKRLVWRHLPRPRIDLPIR